MTTLPISSANSTPAAAAPAASLPDSQSTLEELLIDALQGFRGFVRGVVRSEQIAAARNGDSLAVPPSVAPSEATDPTTTVPLPPASSPTAARWETLETEIVQCRRQLHQLGEAWQTWVRDEANRAQQLREELGALRSEVTTRLTKLAENSAGDQAELTPTGMTNAPSPVVASSSSPPPFSPRDIANSGTAPNVTGLLGPEFSRQPVLAAEFSQLLEAVSRSEPAAGALVGYLLLFQNASAADKPRLLRPLGEAFYRWHPKQEQTSNLEEAVVTWVNRECQSCGVPTRVELVSLPCRFDIERHQSQGRPGRDVTEVFGWVVRTGDRIFDRAMVGAH
ncbi:MAG: hypothetical protein U1A77_19300 [Pirellulales bacterium]